MFFFPAVINTSQDSPSEEAAGGDCIYIFKEKPSLFLSDEYEVRVLGKMKRLNIRRSVFVVLCFRI